MKKLTIKNVADGKPVAGDTDSSMPMAVVNYNNDTLLPIPSEARNVGFAQILADAADAPASKWKKFERTKKVVKNIFA